MDTTRLEAIMFTDIAGYSRLMEEDEDRTIRLLKNHNDIVLPLIESASGDVIDAIGDGLLVVFPSVRNAVGCAVAIHDAIARHNAAAEAGERFKLRIGIHLGEVRHEDGRAYGTGINIAARVQPFARPGGICITEDVYRHVERRISQQMSSIGTRDLRNIARPFELYDVVTGNEDETGDRGGSRHGASGSTGEFDQVKERILREIADIGQKRARTGRSNAERNSLEDRIESKVYGVVERVMDHAIEKWETMPDEKKRKAIQSARVHIDLDKKKHKKDDDDEDSPASIAGKLVFGVVASIGFGLGAFHFGIGWMVWPFAILGVLPFVSGVHKWVKQTVRNRQERSERPARLEREILRVAGRLGGRVTVVQIAAETGHALDDVQSTLDAMTRKGYVSQDIGDDGVISYGFPALPAE